MKGKVTIEFDTVSGEYELDFKNISDPGEGIDYAVMQRALRQVISDVDRQVGGKLSATDQVIRNDN